MTGPERIPRAWGGGWIITGRCGHPHLKGAAWGWWRCPHCWVLPRQLEQQLAKEHAA